MYVRPSHHAGLAGARPKLYEHVSRSYRYDRYNRPPRPYLSENVQREACTTRLAPVSTSPSQLRLHMATRNPAPYGLDDEVWRRNSQGEFESRPRPRPTYCRHRFFPFFELARWRQTVAGAQWRRSTLLQ